MEKQVLDTFNFKLKEGEFITTYTLYLMRINGCYNDSLLVHKNDKKATLREILYLFSLLYSSNTSLIGDSYTLKVSLKGLVTGNKLVNFDGGSKGIYIANIIETLSPVLGVIFNKESNEVLNIAFHEDINFIC